jgi:adenylate cyclase
LAREQRRLAAIVAADVVGYSRLMGRDESGTLARLRENRKERLEPILARYSGRLVKLTGDGALIEFASASTRCRRRLSFSKPLPTSTESVLKPNTSFSALVCILAI